MKKIPQIRVLQNSWFSSFPMNGGPQVTLEELFDSLQRIAKQQQLSTNLLDQWIIENKFLSTLPVEMFLGRNISTFQRTLSNYHFEVDDFLAQGEKFYLWAQKS